MGQKVNPIGLRLGINRSWDSLWYAKKKEFGKFLIEDYKIRKFIKKNIVNSGISQIIIERAAKKCIVTIYTSRPGFVIGKKGSDIEKIETVRTDTGQHIPGLSLCIFNPIYNGRDVKIIDTRHTLKPFQIPYIENSVIFKNKIKVRSKVTSKRVVEY